MLSPFDICNRYSYNVLFLLHCPACPKGCDDCTVDYNESPDKTVCTVGGCATWNEIKAYTDGETGECIGNVKIISTLKFQLLYQIFIFMRRFGCCYRNNV